MNKKVIAFSICVLLLAGCNPSSSESTPTATTDQVVSETPPTDQENAGPPTFDQAASETPPTDQENAETPTSDQAASETPPSDQEALKDEWRQAYNHSELLFAICETMLTTQAEYGRGEIDITEARSDFAAEDNFLALVVTWQFDWVVSSEAVVPYYQRLMNDMEALIDISFQLSQMDDDEIASLVTEQAIFEACDSLFNTRQQIALAAMDAGLTEESLNEFFAEIKEIIEDIYNTIG
jgi:predicted transcriptional regulator